jgi:hypothetical protein
LGGFCEGERVIPQHQADECIERAAHDLMQMSYSELRGLAHRVAAKADDGIRGVKIGGEEAYVSMMICEVGVIRRRVCVELVLLSEDGTRWPRVPAAYFEKFKSGRLYTPRATIWNVGALCAFVLLGIASVLFLGTIVSSCLGT